MANSKDMRGLMALAPHPAPPPPLNTAEPILRYFPPKTLREVCGKSKWKFLMAFAIRGGGVLRGSRLPLSYFEK